MHKLRRGQPPACLARYRHGLHNWAHVAPEERAAIWDELEKMQGNRCAYCEAAISSGERHIEHFIQKDRDDKMTFAWSNLFGSCNRKASCGKHKDSLAPYNRADLIKPDIEDPEHFFLFVTDGTIAIRVGLNATDRHRAQETLRIFNLDARHGALRAMRKQAAMAYLQFGEDARAMVVAGECSIADCLQLLQSELSATAGLPFSTAIKHTLIPSSP